MIIRFNKIDKDLHDSRKLDYNFIDLVGSYSDSELLNKLANVDWNSIEKSLDSILTNLIRLSSRSSNTEEPMKLRSSKNRLFIIIDDEALSFVFRFIKNVRKLVSNAHQVQNITRIVTLMSRIEVTLPKLWMFSESSNLIEDRIDRLRGLTGLDFSGSQVIRSVPMVFSDYGGYIQHDGPTVSINLSVVIFDFPIPTSSIRDKNKMLRRITKTVSEAISSITKRELASEVRYQYYEIDSDGFRFLELFSEIGFLFTSWNIPPRSIELSRGSLDIILHHVRNEFKRIESGIRNKELPNHRYVLKNYINTFNLFTKFKEFTYEDFKSLSLEFNFPFDLIVSESNYITFNLDLSEFEVWISRLISEVGEKEVFKRIGILMGSNVERSYLVNSLYKNLLLDISSLKTRDLEPIGGAPIRISYSYRRGTINAYFPKIKEELNNLICYFFDSGGNFPTKSLDLLSPKITFNWSAVISRFNLNLNVDLLDCDSKFLWFTKTQLKALKEMIDEESDLLKVTLWNREEVLVLTIECDKLTEDGFSKSRLFNLVFTLNIYGLLDSLLVDTILNLIIKNPLILLTIKDDKSLPTDSLDRSTLMDEIRRRGKIELAWYVPYHTSIINEMSI